MEQEEIEALAESWIDSCLLPDSSSSGHPDVRGEVFDLSFDDPETLWRFILASHRRNQSTKIEEALSAGPLEELLAHYGEQFIDRIEKEARDSASFASLLGGVWQNSVSDAVWGRVQSVWDRSGWDN
jgi:hypothetical protein